MALTQAQVAHQNEMVTYKHPNIFGQFFRCSRRTAAHLDYTRARLAKVNPRAVLHIIQGCYNTSVSASAGTHDFDAVLDVAIAGMDWPDAQLFLRRCGWGAWWRKPPTFTNHIHMISLGYTSHVGIYVPGQVADYWADRSGLVGHVPDNTPHPQPQFIFNFYEHGQEDEMQADDFKKIREIVSSELEPLERRMSMFRSSVQKRDALMIGLLRDLDDDVEKVLAESKDDATKDQITGVRQKINRAVEKLEEAIVAEHDEPQADQPVPAGTEK